MIDATPIIRALYHFYIDYASTFSQLNRVVEFDCNNSEN